MVVARTGQASYRISVRLGIYQDVHASQLKLAEGEAVELVFAWPTGGENKTHQWLRKFLTTGGTPMGTLSS